MGISSLYLTKKKVALNPTSLCAKG